MAGANNRNLHGAKRAKQDEFYTQLTDIEKELKHYKSKLKDKVVLCNCDDPMESNFVKYFSLQFEHLGLKKLLATHYIEAATRRSRKPYMLEYTGDKDGNRMPDLDEFTIKMIGDGDFRSEECIELLKQADIVVTNPPFSLFREYVAQLVKYKKKFLIIGNVNAITYKEIFPLIKAGKMWMGASIHSGDREFQIPDDYVVKSPSLRIADDGRRYIRVSGVRWFTNLDYPKRHENITLYRKYSRKLYPKYDNYNAIEVSKTAAIPMDYPGVMGVPITFLDKHNPDQFEIVSANDFRRNKNVPFKSHGLIKDKDGAINGKPTYVRILIRNKKLEV